MKERVDKGRTVNELEKRPLETQKNTEDKGRDWILGRERGEEVEKSLRVS